MKKLKIFGLLSLILCCSLILQAQDDNTIEKNDQEVSVKEVETMPRFPGCEEMEGIDLEKKTCAERKMLEFIFTNLKYPGEARENGIEGTVVTRFIIEKDGSVSNAEIVRGIGGGCDEEVLRIMNMMPKWTPGTQRGEAVRVQFHLPVKFGLEKPKKKKKKRRKGK